VAKINGDLGLYSGTSITGLGSIQTTGAVHIADGVAQLAQNDASAAFTALKALSPATNLSGQDLGGMTLTPGVYGFSSSAGLGVTGPSGTLILDFASDPNGAFVFNIGSTLTTASGANVVVENGGPQSTIYWVLGATATGTGGSATLGTATTFAGNILANTSITLNTGANILCGRAIALTGAITMDGNTVSNSCGNGGSYGTGRSDFSSLGFSGAAVPEPATWTVLLIGFIGVGAAMRSRRKPAIIRA
jgi:type VI secretion system secreted protein VgrG